VDEGMLDGGCEQRPGHAGAALAGGDHKTTHRPHLVPARIPDRLRSRRRQNL
jgi:hypothetical protein